ncbi:POTRA domain-containing protein [Pseudarcicella hirudinis]|uniref:POTRA domain-containing protein n=1 Tax=Pseudarcicella hirudinis TaxID=1079859 RepID=UPI0035E49EF2
MATKMEGTRIWLNIALKERPRLYKVQYSGIRKGEQETLNDKIKTYKGKIITETLKKNVELAIRKHFQEKGYLNIVIKTAQKTDSLRGNNATLSISVNKKSKVKINKIIITGLKETSERTIRRKLKDTKQMRFGRISNLRNTFRRNLKKISRN